MTIGRVDYSVTEQFVAVDFHQIGRLAGISFGAKGFERVLYLYGDLHLLPGERQQFEGFCSGFAETTGHLPSALRFARTADSPQEFGYKAIREYLARNPAPEAVFAGGDYLAIGAIRALRECGLSCPGDVAVIGSTGLDIAEFTQPSLTTIKQPMMEVGREVVRRLVAMASGDASARPGCVLPAQMAFRETLPASDELVFALRAQFPNLRITGIPSAETALHTRGGKIPTRHSDREGTQ